MYEIKRIITLANDSSTPEEALPYFKKIFNEEDKSAYRQLIHSYFWNFWCKEHFHEEAYHIFMKALGEVEGVEAIDAKDVVVHYCYNELYGYENLLEWRDAHVTSEELEEFMKFRKLLESGEPDYRVNI